MTESIKENVTRRSIWIRLVFMIVLGVAFSITEGIIFVVVVFQFLASLLSGQPNDQLIRFGRGLAHYLQQITVYLAFATEEKPFPFAPWPSDSTHDMRGEEASGQQRDSSENYRPDSDQAQKNDTNDSDATGIVGDTDRRDT